MDSEGKKFVDPTFASRDADYAEVIAVIEKTKRCPFCRDHFQYHQNPILKEFNGWLITENSWPYEGSKIHLIILNPDQHKETISELTTEDMVAIHHLINWAIGELKITGGGICLRFGETLYTGATVCHIHTHLIVPKIDSGTSRAKVINFPIG